MIICIMGTRQLYHGNQTIDSIVLSPCITRLICVYNNALMYRAYCVVKDIKYLCECVTLGSTHLVAQSVHLLVTPV